MVLSFGFVCHHSITLDSEDYGITPWVCIPLVCYYVILEIAPQNKFFLYIINIYVYIVEYEMIFYIKFANHVCLYNCLFIDYGFYYTCIFNNCFISNTHVLACSPSYYLLTESCTHSVLSHVFFFRSMNGLDSYS